jgi:hypothetical protein
MVTLGAVREAMDAVHKQMLDASRADFELLNGPIAGPGQFLELLMGHPFFAWLRPMSGLMAEIDEAMDEPETLDALRVKGFRERLEAILLEPRYLHYLQISPDLVMDHAALRRALSRL